MNILAIISQLIILRDEILQHPSYPPPPSLPPSLFLASPTLLLYSIY